MSASDLPAAIVLILLVKFYPNLAYPLIAMLVALMVVGTFARRRTAAAALRRETKHLEDVYSQYLHMQNALRKKWDPNQRDLRITSAESSYKLELDELNKRFKADLDRREQLRKAI